MNSYQGGEHQGDESVSELIRGILRDARTLSIQEFTAVKLEIRQEIIKAILSSLWLCVGVFVLALGIGFLSVVAALLLARFAELPVWVALAIIGGAYLLIGVILIFVSRSSMARTSPLPRRSLQSAKQDVHYIREKATGH